jgi:hypothetical protein
MTCIPRWLTHIWFFWQNACMRAGHMTKAIAKLFRDNVRFGEKNARMQCMRMHMHPGIRVKTPSFFSFDFVMYVGRRGQVLHRKALQQ